MAISDMESIIDSIVRDINKAFTEESSALFI